MLGAATHCQSAESESEVANGATCRGCSQRPVQRGAAGAGVALGLNVLDGR